MICSRPISSHMSVDEQVIHRDCVLVAFHRCVIPIDVVEVEVSSDEMHGLLVLLQDAE